MANLPMQSKYPSGSDIPIRLINYWANKNDHLWGGVKDSQPNYGRARSRQQLLQRTDEQLAALEAEFAALPNNLVYVAPVEAPMKRKASR